MRTRIVLMAGAFVAALLVNGMAQTPNAFPESRDHAAIRYSTAPVNNRITVLNRALADGSVRLEFDPISGYLPSTLEALGISTTSQLLVFSPTSLQTDFITIRNPRALYFDDSVAVGWVRGGPLLEVAVQDPRQGAIFYDLPQEKEAVPQFERNDECLACHLAWESFAVPGFLMTSTAPRRSALQYATGFSTDHRTPFIQRWGGWFVTGTHGGPHMGNVPVAPDEIDNRVVAEPLATLPSMEGLLDLTGYPTPHSDLVALQVLAHQTGMANRIARLGWEARLAAFNGTPAGTIAPRVRDAAGVLVDYLLMVDEAPLPGPMQGTSGFAEHFASLGPRDVQGRSLRDLDLEGRLLRYPCSFMIYSEVFDALPSEALDAVYTRLWAVLSGEVLGAPYDRLTPADRRAIVEILIDTKPGLPEYFQPLVL